MLVTKTRKLDQTPPLLSSQAPKVPKVSGTSIPGPPPPNPPPQAHRSRGRSRGTRSRGTAPRSHQITRFSSLAIGSSCAEVPRIDRNRITGVDDPQADLVATTGIIWLEHVLHHLEAVSVVLFLPET